MRRIACLWMVCCACGSVVDAPDPVTVTISPASPVTTDDLMANVTDGGSRTFTYRWSSEAGTAMGAMLPASMTTKGDVWKVEAVDSDVVVGSAMVTIQNSPVSLTTPTIKGLTWASAPVICSVMATDPDETDQVTVTVTWEMGGAAYTGTTATTVNANDTIPKDTTHEGETYKCLITASDGTAMTMGEATAMVTAHIAYTVAENATAATFQKIDLDTGVITDIGPLGVGYNFGDLAWDRAAQKLYMIDGRGAKSLYTINTTTGAATLVGVHNLTDAFALGVAPTGLYAVTTGSANTLYQLDTTTGAPTLVGAMTGATTGRLEGLVFDSANNRMVAESTGGVFYTIDMATGAATLLGGSMSMNDFGLTYDPYIDRYYALDYSARLQSFDTTTFAASVLKTGLNAHSSIALPLPAP